MKRVWSVWGFENKERKKSGTFTYSLKTTKLKLKTKLYLFYLYGFRNTLKTSKSESIASHKLTKNRSKRGRKLTRPFQPLVETGDWKQREPPPPPPAGNGERMSVWVSEYLLRTVRTDDNGNGEESFGFFFLIPIVAYFCLICTPTSFFFIIKF